MLRGIYSDNNWDSKDLDRLEKEPVTKERLIDLYLDKKLPSLLEKKSEAEIFGELNYHGYSFTDVYGKSKKDLINHTMEVIKKLEKRALVFLEGHPLSMLTSPEDGVARGIIITRTIPQTREIIYDILTNNIKYKIERNEYGWALIETKTGSPIRVITADRTLTSAFWDKICI